MKLTLLVRDPALPRGGDRQKRAQGPASKAVLKTIGSRLGWILISGLTGMMTARALGPPGRGALAAMIMWPVFLAGVLTLGLPSALIYQITRAEPADRAGLFTAATLLATLVGGFACVGGVLILPLWLSRYDHHIVRWAQWLMVFTVVSILMLVFRSAFEALGKFGTSASTWLIGPMQTAVTLFILWRLHHLTELTAALSYVLAGPPVLIWMFIRLNREFGWSFNDFGRSSRTLLSYGLRSYGIDLCGTLSQSVDQALVVGMISASDMGRYVVALSLSRTLNSVYQAAAAVLFPKCIGMNKHQSFALTCQMTAATTALTIPGAILLCVFGSSLLRLLYGSDYVIATTLLQLLTAEAVLSGITTLMSQPFMAMGRPGTVTVLQALGLSVTIPLLLVLVPRFGTVGAGFALFGTALLRLILLFICFIRLANRLPNSADVNALFVGARGRLKQFSRPAERPAGASR
jgi:O-antigen/teichoic acid export membrane protein